LGFLVFSLFCSEVEVPRFQPCYIRVTQQNSSITGEVPLLNFQNTHLGNYLFSAELSFLHKEELLPISQFPVKACTLPMSVFGNLQTTDPVYLSSKARQAYVRFLLLNTDIPLSLVINCF
jgi:hypothetical protein